MRRWAARAALLLIAGAILVALLLIHVRPATGFFLYDTGDSAPLLIVIVDLALLFTAITGGIAAAVLAYLLVAWLWTEAR